MGVCGEAQKLRYGKGAFVATALIIAASGYLYHAIQTLRAAATCTADEIHGLKERENKLPEAIRPALKKLDMNDIETARTHVHHIDQYLCLVFPFPIVCLLVITAGCSARTSKRRWLDLCTKLMLLLTNLLLLLYLLMNVAFIGLALNHDRPVLTDRWDDATTLCPTNLLTLAKMLKEADAQLADAPAGPERTAALLELDAARTTQATFVKMCGCMVDDVPRSLADLGGPGAIGLVAAVAGLVATLGVCCAYGCCGLRRLCPSSRVADDLDEESSEGTKDPNRVEALVENTLDEEEEEEESED